MIKTVNHYADTNKIVGEFQKHNSKGFFRFEGRIDRIAFLLRTIILMVLMGLFPFLGLRLILWGGCGTVIPLGVAALAFGIALLIGNLALGFRRFHDIGLSGWPMLVVYFGPVVQCICFRGTLTGSDWCIWCKRLDGEVFSTLEFIRWARGRVVLLKVDFPRNIRRDNATQEANQKLMGRFGVRGFPTVILLDENGSEKARTGYQRGGAASYIQHLESLL